MSNKEVEVDDDLVCCSHGGDYHPEDEMIEVGGEFYHQDIINEVCVIPYKWGEWVFQDECVWSDVYDEWIHEDDVVYSYDDDVLCDGEESYYDFYYVRTGVAEDFYVHHDNLRYCEDIDEDVHEDDAYYCEDDGCYYYDEDNCNVMNDYEICEYHKTPNPEDISKNSEFKIGFEIEKTDFDGYCDSGDDIGYYALFKGYELDGSCGVEAITHILPLSGVRSKRRADLFKMMDNVKWIINSDYNTDCGGHITISWKGHTYEQLLEKVAYNMCIVYALYRYRLKNTYCQNNKNLKDSRTAKYSVIKYNNSSYNQSLELRLPSAVRNVKQLKLRYDLMFQILKHSCKTDDSYSKLWRKVKPIIMKMYNGDKARVKVIQDYAKLFRTYLITDEVDRKIDEFINNNND